MPHTLPDIPSVDEKTPYPAFKKAFEKLRAAVLRGWLLDGENTTVVNAVGASGRMVNADQGGGAAVITTIPFRCSKVDDTTIRVFRGSVTTPDGTFTPAGFSAGDNPVFTITVAGDGVVYLYVTIDGATGEVLTAEDPDSAATIPANTATEFYIELGSFSTDVDDVLAVQSNELGALYFELCGGVDPVWGGFNDT